MGYRAILSDVMLSEHNIIISVLFTNDSYSFTKAFPFPNSRTLVEIRTDLKAACAALVTKLDNVENKVAVIRSKAGTLISEL